MSWLSSIFHDLVDPIANLFNPKPDNTQTDAINAQTAALQAQTASAKTAAAAALKAQTDANTLAAAAAVPTSDSESARSAADDEKRKLLQGSNFGIGLPTQLGAPPVGYRVLSGQ